MKKSIDIVYLLNTKKESKILPLSIKTVKTNLDYKDIYIAGIKPENIKAKEIRVIDNGSPFENAVKKLKAVIKDKRVSQDFILMNDDFLILQEYKEIPYYHRGKIKDFKPNTYWKKRLKLIEKEFPNGKMFNIHFPIVYNKQKLKKILDKAHGSIRTYYCNYHNIEGEYHEDHKIYQKAKIKDHADAPFLSTSKVVENTRLKEIEKIIKKRL